MRRKPSTTVDGELHAQRVSLLVGLHGGDKGRLAGRATTALAAASLAAEIGVVELDPPADASAVPKVRVNGRSEDVIFFDGVFFESSLKSIFFAS